VNGLKIILAAVLVAINAFFVIAEYGLVRSSRARLETIAEEGLRGARVTLFAGEQIPLPCEAVGLRVQLVRQILNLNAESHFYSSFGRPRVFHLLELLSLLGQERLR